MRLLVLGLGIFTALCIGSEPEGWQYVKDNPVTKKRIIDIGAESFD